MPDYKNRTMDIQQINPPGLDTRLDSLRHVHWFKNSGCQAIFKPHLFWKVKKCESQESWLHSKLLRLCDDCSRPQASARALSFHKVTFFAIRLGRWYAHVAINVRNSFERLKYYQNMSKAFEKTLPVVPPHRMDQGGSTWGVDWVAGWKILEDMRHWPPR